MDGIRFLRLGRGNCSEALTGSGWRCTRSRACRRNDTWDELRNLQEGQRFRVRGLMGATMAVIMLGFMRMMYRNRLINAVIVIGSVAVFRSRPCWCAVRQRFRSAPT